MARKKVKLSFIMNDATRKATYKKRKNCLLKKVSELSTLCGIDACAIIYSPYDPQPEVWPGTLEVQRIIAQLKKMPEMEQTRNMLDQETFLKQMITKLNEQLRKQRMDNHEKELIELMYQCLLIGNKRLQNLMPEELNDLGLQIEQKLKEINERIEDIKNMASQLQVAWPPPQPPMITITSQIQPSGMQLERQHNYEHELFSDFNLPIENRGFTHGGGGKVINDAP